MPSTEQAVRVPKAVSKFVANLGPTPNIDLNKASQKERTSLLNALYYETPKDDPKRKEYNSLKSQADKQKWLSTWVLAASQGKSMGWNSAEVSTTSTEMTTGVWVTQSMLASPQYFNNEEIAAIFVKTAPSRPYKNSVALAEAGVLEYYYELDSDKNARQVKSAAGVESKAELSAEEYDEISASMQVGFEKGPPAKKPKGIPKKVHPVFAKLSVGKRFKEKALKMLRESVDKIMADLDKVQNTKDKLAKKGWHAGEY